MCSSSSARRSGPAMAVVRTMAADRRRVRAPASPPAGGGLVAWHRRILAVACDGNARLIIAITTGAEAPSVQGRRGVGPVRQRSYHGCSRRLPLPDELGCPLLRLTGGAATSADNAGNRRSGTCPNVVLEPAAEPSRVLTVVVSWDSASGP